MFESVIMLLVWLCVLAIIVYIALWVLAEVGIVIPPKIMRLVWVIVVLLVILYVARMLLPHMGGMGFR